MLNLVGLLVKFPLEWSLAGSSTAILIYYVKVYHLLLLLEVGMLSSLKCLISDVTSNESRLVLGLVLIHLHAWSCNLRWLT